MDIRLPRQRLDDRAVIDGNSGQPEPATSTAVVPGRQPLLSARAMALVERP
ncbi:MAG TPA: hypothetical protein VFW92_08930 [Candidatus Limnocylindrales bacterium]|jgi:hypothetical protein|nr:hypothetical protein [Candidatus Limnocylindrales bacterium]